MAYENLTFITPGEVHICTKEWAGFYLGYLSLSRTWHRFYRRMADARGVCLVWNRSRESKLTAPITSVKYQQVISSSEKISPFLEYPRRMLTYTPASSTMWEACCRIQLALNPVEQCSRTLPLGSVHCERVLPARNVVEKGFKHGWFGQIVLLATSLHNEHALQASRCSWEGRRTATYEC